jgi:hypothetical protein
MHFRPVGTTPIVAWHEVPGKRGPKDPSRRVRYDRAQLIRRSSLVESASRRTTPDRSGTKCPMMFELLFDVMDRFLNT